MNINNVSLECFNSNLSATIIKQTCRKVYLERFFVKNIKDFAKKEDVEGEFDVRISKAYQSDSVTLTFYLKVFI
jgi:hypothetical protein